MEIEKILAIATAVIFEENKEKTKTAETIVLPAPKGKLAKYLEENNILYQKYQLGDEYL